MVTLNAWSIAIYNDEAVKTNYINVIWRVYQLCSLRGDNGHRRPACHATTKMENTKVMARMMVDVRIGVEHGSDLWLDPIVLHGFRVSSRTSNRFIPGFFRPIPASVYVDFGGERKVVALQWTATYKTEFLHEIEKPNVGETRRETNL